MTGCDTAPKSFASRNGVWYSRPRMEYTNIRVENRPPLAVITLDRPKALNALNTATLAELESAFEAESNDPGTRVVLLTGAGGRAFAAGADIRELAAIPSEEG